MLSVRYDEVRNDFKKLCDKVYDGETLVIVTPNEENIVMLPETEYKEMMKAKRNADYLAMLDQSMAEAKAGGFITDSFIESM